MTISPAILIGGLVPPVDVSAGATVNGALVSTSGVKFFAVTVTATDETNTVATIQATLSVNQSAKSFSFTAPGGAGSAVIVRVQVGINGLMLDANSQYQASFAQTFKINVIAANGLRVFAVGELTEQDPAFGYTSVVNAGIRNSGGGGGGGSGGAGGQFNLALSNGRNDNLSTTGLTLGLIGGPTAAFSISGIATSATTKTGLPIVLVNTTAFQMTLNHEDTNSSAANRIRCLSGDSKGIVLKPFGGAATLYYDNTVSSRWYAISRGWETQSPRSYDIREAGAKCDLILAGQVGQMTASGTDLTLSSGTPFLSTDVGKNITVTGAGTAGADLHTTIASFVSSSHVTTTAAAGTTVPSALTVYPNVQKGWVYYGTDDSTAWSNAITAVAAGATIGVLLVHASSYLVSQQTIPINVALECEEGAVIHSEATLNIYGRIKAHSSQHIFSHATLVSFLNQAGTDSPRTTETHAEWWGAKGDSTSASGSGTDNTRSFNSGATSTCTMGKVSASGRGGHMMIGYGMFRVTGPAWTIDQGVNDAQAGFHVTGKGVGTSGSVYATCICADFNEPHGTNATLSSTGVLTTQAGDPAWTSASVGTWVYLPVGVQTLCKANGTAPPAVTLSNVVSSANLFKIIVTQGGSNTTALFDWSQNGGVTYTRGVAMAATVLLGGSGVTATFPAGTYRDNLVLQAQGTSPPAVTLTTSVTSRLQLVIEIITPGVLAAATAQVSTDGGTTFSAPAAISSGTLTATTTEGTVTINFPSGTYTGTGAGQNIWRSGQRNTYLGYTIQGAWKVSAFTDATHVTITDPSGEFPLSNLPANETGLSWWNPTLTIARYWSRDCIQEGLYFVPCGQKVVYAAWEDTKSASGSVACSDNSFLYCGVDTQGFTGTIFVHGCTHADTPGTPGGSTAGIQDCENDKYEKCTFSRCEFSGRYNPNVAGQSYDEQFLGCTFLGNAGRTRCGLWNQSGSLHLYSCTISSSRTGIQSLNTTFIDVQGLTSESCDRFHAGPLDNAAAFIAQYIGGRIAVNRIAEDGLMMDFSTAGSTILSGLAFDPTYCQDFTVRAQGNAGLGCPHTLTAIGCYFPRTDPILKLLPATSSFVKVSLTGCSGTTLSAVAGEIADLASVKYQGF